MPSKGVVMSKANAFWAETELTLLPGEELLHVGEPEAGKLVWAQTVAIGLVLLICFFPLLVIMPLQIWLSNISARRHRYFVTSQRVVVTNGLIGYNTRSVPLERISDVQIGCTWIDRLFDIRSVVVRDMTGEAQGGAKMLGVQNAPELQEIILRQVRVANARSETGDSPPQVRPSTSGQPANDEVVALLREIRDAVVKTA